MTEDSGDPPPTRHDPYAALRHRDFRWYIVSLFCMTIASQLQAVVVGWRVYEITHDPLSLGLLGISGMADKVSVVIRSTLLQLLTPPEMLGRVSAVTAHLVPRLRRLGRMIGA